MDFKLFIPWVMSLSYKKLSTLIILVFFILILVFFLSGFLIIKAKSKPQQIRASTVGTNTFTVTHFTDWKSKSKLLVSENQDFNNPLYFMDERDYDFDGKEGSIESRHSHVLTARGLKPDTKYWYKVESLFNSEFDEEVFTVKTPKLSNEVPVPVPLFGYVVDKNNEPLRNIIIEVHSIAANDTRSSTISTYTAENGSYSLDLSNLRTLDLSTYWNIKDGIPNKVVVTAKSNQEKFYYEIIDGNYDPVDTFAFDSTDQSYSNKFVEEIKAEGKCTYNTGDDCSSNCNGSKGTYYCLDPSTGADECRCEGNSSSAPSTSQRDEDKCREALEAKQNCDFLKKDQNKRVCGWEESYKTLASEGNCGALDTPESTPDRDKSREVCNTLHTTYARAFGPGGQFEGEACKAGNFARQEALKEGGDRFKDSDCGTGKKLRYQDPNCGSAQEQTRDPVKQTDNQNCQQAGSGNNEFFKCDKSKGQGYAIAYTDRSCNAVANPEYCNGACVDSGETNECLIGSEPAREALDQPPENDAPPPINLPSSVQNAPERGTTEDVEDTPERRTTEDVESFTAEEVEDTPERRTAEDVKSFTAEEVEEKNSACRAAELGDAVIFYNGDHTLKENPELICFGELELYKCQDTKTSITKVDSYTGDIIPAYTCMGTVFCDISGLQLDKCSREPLDVINDTSRLFMCQSDNFSIFCDENLQCETSEVIAYLDTNGKLELTCRSLALDDCLREPEFALKRLDSPGDRFKYYKCVQKATFPVCQNMDSLSCYANEIHVPDGINTTECYNEDDRIVRSCECNAIDGKCSNTAEIPMPRPGAKGYRDDGTACSGGLVRQVNGQDSFCFISHCMYSPRKNSRVASTLITENIVIQPYSCVNGEEYTVNVGDFYSIDDSYADPIMCANIPSGHFDSCASVLQYPQTSISIGDELEYISQSTKITTFEVIGRDSETTYRQEHQTPGFIATSSDGQICHGDSGGVMYSLDGNAVGSVSYWVTEEGEPDPDYSLVNDIGCSSHINIVPFNTPSTGSIENRNTEIAETKTLEFSSKASNTTRSNDTFLSKVIPSAKAAEGSNSLQINQPSFKLDAGQYKLSNGVNLNFTSPTEVNQYSDLNGNGKRDLGEPKVIGMNLTIEKVSDGFEYNFNNGWNTANFPFFKDNENMYTASEIRALALGQGVDIESIKKWNGKWVEYSVNQNTVYGQDFSIKPNEGYFVKALTPGKFTIFGSVSSEPVPVQLHSGWSLVGFAPGMSQEADGAKFTYTNESFEDSIDALELLNVLNKSGIKADNLSKWDNGLYRGVNIKNGLEFGLDFKLNRTKAYFVRADRKIVFTP